MRAALERALGRRVDRLEPLAGGQVGRVVAVTLAGGERVVAKRSAGLDLTVEAKMLALLGRLSALPVPTVLHAEASLLIMSFLVGRTGLDRAAEAHLGDLVSELHGVSAERFGLAFDTAIGRFTQPNRPSRDWAAFFVERRLRPMCALAVRHGRLPEALAARLEALLPTIGAALAEHRPRPALLHGDLWSGNVLAQGGRVSGVLDPALYFGDPEADLAYVALFDSFGPAFWEAYRSVRPEGEGAAARRSLYQLYPLLCHVAHFGAEAGYLPPLVSRLERLEAHALQGRDISQPEVS